MPDVTIDDLERMKRTLIFGADDVAALREAHAILTPQIEAILDVWYGFVGSQPHLLAHFSRPGGDPIPAYLAAVRVRFGQWIADTLRAEYDEAWLAYQLEIGRRHHRIGKNKTDRVDASPHIGFSDLVPLIYPIFATIEPFLAKGGASPERVAAMHHAWLKSLLLQITLWSYPYVNRGDY